MAKPSTSGSTPSSRELPTPELGSLRDIILKHPRTRIFLQPALWNAVHLELLDCTILPKQGGSCPCFAIRPPSTVVLLSSQDYKDANKIHKSLLAAKTVGSVDGKITMLMTFLTEKLVEVSVSNPLYSLAFKTKSTAAVWLNYYEQRRLRLRCTIVYRLRLDQQQGLAFLSHNGRPYIPQKVHHRGVSRKVDSAYMESIKNLPIDPYYVAILISLAQERCYNGDRSQYIKVNLLTPSRSPDALTLYSSYIPREYLKKFTDPLKFHKSKILISQLEISLLDLDKIIAIFGHILGECEDKMSLLRQAMEANENIGTGDVKYSSGDPTNVDEKPIIDKGRTANEYIGLPVHGTVDKTLATTMEPQSTQKLTDSTKTSAENATSESSSCCQHCGKHKMHSVYMAEESAEKTNTEDKFDSDGEPSPKRAKTTME